MSGAERKAVALTYRAGEERAPRVTASGRGMVADEIIRRAKEAGVPITQDAPLVTLLSQLDLGEMIPPDLYLVVAEILVHVYRLESRVGRDRKRQGPPAKRTA
ncbi:MAG: EscU/YscU/HrcU family type III secretion system export apparatus switch protein [Chloroflexota bacterium]